MSRRATSLGALDHQPGGPGGQFPPRDRTAVGSSTSPSRRGRRRTHKGTATRPAAARPLSSDAGRTAGRCRNRAARSRGPTSRLPASEPNTWTGTPSASAASTPRPAAATTPPEPTAARRQGPADRRGSRRRQDATCDADPPLVRAGAGGRARRSSAASAGGRRVDHQRQGRAAAIASHRVRGPPRSAACAATVPNPRASPTSRAGTRHGWAGGSSGIAAHPLDDRGGERRPWRSSPAARRRSPEAGGRQGLGQAGRQVALPQRPTPPIAT